MVSGMYLLDFFETKQKAWASSLFVDVRKKVRPWAEKDRQRSRGPFFVSSVKDKTFFGGFSCGRLGWWLGETP